MQQVHAASEVVSGLALGAAVSSVSLAFGAPGDALVAGLLGAVSISFWLETIDNKARAAWAILFSALLAVYGSPAAATKMTSLFFEGADPESLRVFMAFIIGSMSPSIVPLLLKLARKKTETTL